MAKKRTDFFKFVYVSTSVDKFMARICFIFIVSIFIAISLPAEAQNKISVEDSVNKFNDIAKKEAYANPERALAFAERALSLSQAYGFEKGMLNSYYSHGLVYYYKSFFVVSNDYYRLILNSPNSDKKQLSAAWNNMGINYEMLGELDSALFAYQKSRMIDHNLGDKKSEHMSLINIGLLNSKLRRYELAVSQTHWAKKYFEETNDLSNLGLCYMNLGLFYYEMGQGDSCLIYYDKSADIYQEIKDYPNLFQTYLNMTSLWVLKKNERKAREAYGKAKALLPFVKSPFYLSSLDAFASLLFDNFGQNDSAIYYSLKALKGFDSLGVKEKVKVEYYNLASLYTETGQTKEYHQAIQRYDSLSKELLNEDINKRLAEMEVRYKLDMKNQQIKNAEELLSEKRTQVFVISLFSLALLVALIFMFRLYARVKSANKNLYQKNIELMAQESRSAQQDEVMTPDMEVNGLLIRFQRLMEDEALFKRPDLTLKMAAQELGTNEKYLSQAVNTGEDNFNTYVNRFRVNEARRIILSGENHMSIEELGLMVGFSNRHTFSRAFSQITGISPSEFRKIHLSRQAEVMH